MDFSVLNYPNLNYFLFKNISAKSVKKPITTANIKKWSHALEITNATSHK